MCAGSLLSEVWRTLHELCPSSGQVFIQTNKKFVSEPLKKVAKRDDTQAGLRPECRLGPREQFNEISSLIDGGVVYSNEPELLHQLRHGRGGGGCEDNDDDHVFRSHKGGLMKTLPMFENKNLRDLLPLKVRPSKKTKLINPTQQIQDKQKNSWFMICSITQLEEPDEGCLRPETGVFCFQGGDARCNENMVRNPYLIIKLQYDFIMTGTVMEICT